MKPNILAITAILISLPLSAAGEPRPLKAGVYKRYHHNKYFRISPPKEFNDMKPIDNGVLLINEKDKLSVKIQAYKIENPKELNDRQLLNRFRPTDYRSKFFASINKLSARKVKKSKFTKFNRKHVFQFTVLDPYNKLNPLRSIIFYENGKEYRITLEADSNKALEKHSHLIKDAFFTIGILE